MLLSLCDISMPDPRHLHLQHWARFQSAKSCWPCLTQHSVCVLVSFLNSASSFQLDSSGCRPVCALLLVVSLSPSFFFQLVRTDLERTGVHCLSRNSFYCPSSFRRSGRSWRGQKCTGELDTSCQHDTWCRPTWPCLGLPHQLHLQLQEQ